jgi:cytochrome P450
VLPRALTLSLGFGIEPRGEVLQPLFGEGIFTVEGERWKHSRDMIRGQLQHRQYGNLNVFRRTVDDLLQIVRARGGIIDLQPLFFRMTLDISARFIFGESVQSLVSLEGSDQRRFADAFDVVQKQATAQMRRYDLRWLGHRRRYQQAQRDLSRLTDQIIDRNLEIPLDGHTRVAHYAFLLAIARNTPDRAALRGQVLNLLAAGRDTTASLLSWTL